MTSPKNIRHRAALLLPVLLLSVGCTSLGLYRQAQTAEQQGDWDEAVVRYLELADKDPGNVAYRTALLRAKIRASQMHFESGKRFHEAGALDRALVEYRQAVELDPTNQYAMVELSKLREDLRQRSAAPGSLTLDEMKEQAKARSQPPLLNPRSNEPIDIEFPEPTSVQDIYRALGKAFGINILFDPNLRDQQIAIELKQVTAQDALEILMRAAQHFYKVLDEHTILVAADTPQNRRAYEDLVIQTFFLSNAEVKDVMTMLRTLVDAKKIAANEQLNAIIVRDSADRVKVAERIIEANDKAKAEVVVDVELLQVNSSKIRELGLELSAYQIGQTLDLGEDVPLRFSDLGNLDQSSWALTIPSFIYNFVKSNSDAQVLAKPQLRITEGEKASLHIGDRVPIPTTTFNTANTVGSNIVPVTSFQYTDVGIKINIEPRVHHNLEVSLVLKVEVSNLSGAVSGPGGQDQPIIGTRNIETTIRLKDGETNFLAGLLRTDEVFDETGIPGLSDIPVLGRLFSNNRTDRKRTDVILTMTPHIIRKSDITEEDLLPIWVGTEQNITFRGGSPRVESDVEGPFDEGTSAAERVRELIRQRVEELPRGLQQQIGEEEAPAEEAPPGTDLVPGLPPSDMFDEPEEEPEEEPVFEEEPESASLGGAAGAPATSLRLAALPTADRAEEAAVSLRLVPGRLAVGPGDRFTVRLEADASSPVAHLPLRLQFDPARLALTGWQAGDFLGAAGEAETLAAEGQPGQVMIGASRLGDRPGVVGQGTVAVLTFTALAAGPTEVTFAAPKALDGALREIGPVVARPLTVEVGDAASERPDRPGRVRETRPDRDDA